jgi:signal transduction histidine kinase
VGLIGHGMTMEAALKDRAGSAQAFPLLGVVLAGVVIGIAIVREFILASRHEPVLARPAVLVLGVVIDIFLLAFLSNRMDAARWSFGRTFFSTLAANLLLGVAYLVGVRALGVAMGIALAATLSVTAVVRVGSMWSLQIFALWALGFRYPKAARDAYLRAQETERLRDQAELAQLRAHLQPHFLRNTLNAIAALITESPREARRLLATLGDLLTDTIEPGAPMHSLDAEFVWLRRYAEILATRYHGTLTFVWDIPQTIGPTMIPTLLLQPLVENAALHGALGRDGGGEVALRARATEEGGVEIVVEDNGPGFTAKTQRIGGLGLRLVQRRLELECPGARFELDTSPRGTRAVLRLP